MIQTVTHTKKRHKTDFTRVRKVLFYSSLMLIPFLHFWVFYIYINFNSVLMAFRHWSLSENGVQVTWVGMSNFDVAWRALSQNNAYLVRNSLIFFACQVFISLPLALLASYYIFKKRFMSGFLRVMLFMPQILSALILGALWRYTSGNVLAWIQENWFHQDPSTYWLMNPDTQIWALIIFNTLMNFGVDVLLYTNGMSSIHTSILESAEIDGATPWQELWHIVLPMIYPTIANLLVIGVATLFVNQYQVYTIYGAGGADMANVGYFLYVEAKADNNSVFGNGVNLSYPELSALGLIMTAITVPITFAIRYGLKKLGPSED